MSHLERVFSSPLGITVSQKANFVALGIILKLNVKNHVWNSGMDLCGLV
jgi:hypothetical protein